MTLSTVLVLGDQMHQKTVTFILNQEECKNIERALVELFVKGEDIIN